MPNSSPVDTGSILSIHYRKFWRHSRLSMRVLSFRSMTVWTMVVLCLCVFMQMLGTSMTLWNFALDSDQATAPLYGGYSLPTYLFDLERFVGTEFRGPSGGTPWRFLHICSLFRPPNSPA